MKLKYSYLRICQDFSASRRPVHWSWNIGTHQLKWSFYWKMCLKFRMAVQRVSVLIIPIFRQVCVLLQNENMCRPLLLKGWSLVPRDFHHFYILIKSIVKSHLSYLSNDRALVFDQFTWVSLEQLVVLITKKLCINSTAQYK